jgi:hypothetical protein
MAETAKLTISGSVTHLRDGGSLTIGPLSPVIASPVAGRVDPFDLSSGFNLVSPPDGATVCIFTPPSDNAETLTLKGVTGDTGVKLSETSPVVISLDGSATTFGITAGGTVAGCSLQFL